MVGSLRGSFASSQITCRFVEHQVDGFSAIEQTMPSTAATSTSGFQPYCRFRTTWPLTATRPEVIRRLIHGDWPLPRAPKSGRMGTIRSSPRLYASSAYRSVPRAGAFIVTPLRLLLALKLCRRALANKLLGLVSKISSAATRKD